MDKPKLGFKRVLLFKAGTFNGVKTTPENLKDMVAFALEHENILPDLKLDHIDDKDKRDNKFKIFENFPFSLGKITNLEYNEVEESLYGDYINVFEPVRNALDDKLLTTHSAEIYYNVVSKKTGKKYSAMLAAVAILPAGKPPALMEVFSPYMYELEQSQDNGLTDFSGFEYENKSIYSIGGSMNKQDYEAKMDGFGCKKRMSFESFAKLTDEEKQEYLETMKDKFKKGDKMEGKEKEPAVAKFSFDDILEKNSELEKKLNSLLESESRRSEALESRIADYERKARSERVEKIMYSLTNTDSPKLLPAMADKARLLLNNADDSKKVNYSFDGQSLEKSVFELAVDLLESLPENKQVFSNNSIVANQDDIKVFASEIEKGTDVDSVIAFKKAEKHFALQVKDINNLTEDELMAYYKSQGLIA